MSSMVIRPQHYRQLGPGGGINFYLVTDPGLAHAFSISPEHGHASATVVLLQDSLEALLPRLAEPAHVLVIAPGRLVETPDGTALGQRKLAIMPVNSTPVDTAVIDHFLHALERTCPVEQLDIAERIFASIGAVEHLTLHDVDYGVTARFQHLAGDYEWFEQAGPLDWGGQQLAPAGEVSVLPLGHGHFDDRTGLAVDGQLAIRGFPIVHGGNVSYRRGDQERIYQDLTTMQHHAVLLTLEGGVVTEVRPSHAAASRAADMLAALFRVDSRYRRLWEIGFGINSAFVPLPGNIGLNEVYGGAHGVVHFGLGLTPFTQYHIDLVCPHTAVYTSAGARLIGPPLPAAAAQAVTAELGVAP